MPNRLPENVYATLLAALPSDRPVSREDFRRYDVPEAISHFLQHALDRRLELETSRITDLAAGWVDHDQEEIALARSAYLRLLGRHAHYPATEWPRALKQAVQLVSAYLVRPVPTLIHFVFGEKRSELAAADVGRRMDYFIAFSHLRTAVAAFVERRPGQPVGRRALTEALEAVDRQICREYTLEDWRVLVGPLSDLGRRTPSQAVGIDLLAQFFESRGGHSIAAGITGYARARELEGLTPDQLESALLLIGAPLEYEGEDADAGDLKLVVGGASPARATSVPVESTASQAEVEAYRQGEVEPEDTAAQEAVAPIDVDAEPLAEAQADVYAKPHLAAPAETNVAPEAGAEPEPPAEPVSESDLTPAPQIAEPLRSVPGLARLESERAQPNQPPSEERAADDAEPLWRQFQNRTEEQETGAHAPVEESDEPLWKKFQHTLDTSKPVRLPPRAQPIRLHPDRALTFEPAQDNPRESEEQNQPVTDKATLEFAVLGPAAWQRDVFIDRVFGGSSHLYFQALERLNACQAWRAASDFIAVDVFRANRVNIYDEAAIDFTNAVEAQFKRR